MKNTNNKLHLLGLVIILIAMICSSFFMSLYMDHLSKVSKIIHIISTETNTQYLSKHTQEAFQSIDSLKMISLTFFLLHIIAFISCCTYFFYKTTQTLYNKQAPVCVENNNALTEKTIKRLENGNFQLGCLTYVANECTLYLGSQKIKTPRREYLLLNMFLNSPSMYLTREEIAAQFWSPKIDYNNKLNVSVGRLRTLLRSEPDLEIVLDRGKGYQLILKDNTLSDEKQEVPDQSTLPKNSSTV